jgi:hypothetical protein
MPKKRRRPTACPLVAASLSASQRFGRFRGRSGHRATIENWSLVTLVYDYS